jgi:hypothetical protein
MNTLTKSMPDLGSLRKAIQEYQLNPRRVPFSHLTPFHDAIVELRSKQASYSVIAELLQQHGVQTSRARVAEYSRIVLNGGRSRKRRKRARTAPVVNAPPMPQSAPVVAPKPAPTITIQPSESAGTSPYRTHGPHIAKLVFKNPEKAKAFEESLAQGKAAKS